ncbi:MAG: hypothetical protein H6713_37020 [Myxococcales bacterium]|nr:hypothetical protein [Myxococcales bacterium]
MSLSLEEEWTVVASGLIAHADEILERGEWDTVLGFLGDSLEPTERETWLEVLSDQGLLEERYAQLSDPPAAFRNELMRRCWRVALADGEGSDIEESVHDRIALRLELDLERVAELRVKWTREAEAKAAATLALAAVFVNLDGHLDFHEAVHFDELLGRSPVPIGRRVELAALLNDPPSVDDVVAQLNQLTLDERLEALGELVPLVRASLRKQEEQAAFVNVMARAGVQGEAAERLIASASTT